MPPAACESDSQCFRSFCEPALAGGPRICCETDCDDVTQACNAQGQCETVPADNGALCSTATDCASGNCDGGRCCPENCGGPCAICSNRGTCEIPSASASASSCSAVACEAQSTDCRTYLPIRNLCEAVGDCKELSDCPLQNASPDTTTWFPAKNAAPSTGPQQVLTPRSGFFAVFFRPQLATTLVPIHLWMGTTWAPMRRQVLAPFQAASIHLFVSVTENIYTRSS